MSNEIDTLIDALIGFRRDLVHGAAAVGARESSVREDLHRLRYLNRRVQLPQLDALLDAAESLLSAAGAVLNYTDVEHLMGLATAAERAASAHHASMPSLYEHSIAFAAEFVAVVAALEPDTVEHDTLRGLRDRLSVLQRGASFLCEEGLSQRIVLALANVDAVMAGTADALELPLLRAVGDEACEMFVAASHGGAADLGVCNGASGADNPAATT